MSDDKVYPLDKAPEQYDRERVLDVCGPATKKLRQQARKLKKACADAEKKSREAWDKMHEFRKTCPHPKDRIVVKVYGMTDDWAKSSWAVANAYCEMCGDCVEPHDDRDTYGQSWSTGGW